MAAKSYTHLKPAAQTSANYIHKTAIIGKDDRDYVSSKYQNLSTGIGILLELNQRKGGVCTAFCVAPNVIATNAHCLIRKAAKGKKRTLKKVLFFLPPIRRTHYERKTLSSTALSSSYFGNHDIFFQKKTNFFKKQNLNQGNKPKIPTSRIDLVSDNQPGLSIFSGQYSSQNTIQNQTQDWAFAKLKRNICLNKTLSFTNAPMSKLLRAARRNEIFMIGFHGDLKMKNRRISQPCRVRFNRNKNYLKNAQSRSGKYAGMLIPHTCDSTGGSSGSPIFLYKERGPEVIGINVATFRQERYTAVRHPFTGKIIKRRLISRNQVNMAVQPVQFQNRLKRYKNERLLTDIEAFKEMQQLLKKMHYYNGEIDGVLGQRTRFAIERFENKKNLAHLGMPTEELLEQLREHERSRESYFRKVVSTTTSENGQENVLVTTTIKKHKKAEHKKAKKTRGRFGRRYNSDRSDTFLDRIYQ